MAFVFPEMDLIDLNSLIEEFNAYTDNLPHAIPDENNLKKALAAEVIITEISRINDNLPFKQTSSQFEIILDALEKWNKTMKSIPLDEDENSPFNKLIALSRDMVSQLLNSVSYQLAHKKYEFYSAIGEDNDILRATDALQEIKTFILDRVEILKKIIEVPKVIPEKKSAFTLSGLFYPKRKSRKIMDSSQLNSDVPDYANVTEAINKLLELYAKLPSPNSNPEIITTGINNVSESLKEYTNDLPNNSKALISDNITQLQVKVADCCSRLNDPTGVSPTVRGIIDSQLRKAYFDFQQTNIGQVLEFTIHTKIIPARKNLTSRDLNNIRTTALVAETDMDKLICLLPKKDLNALFSKMQAEIAQTAAQQMNISEKNSPRPRR